MMLCDLHYNFKKAPSVTAKKIRKAIKLSSQIREDCLVYVSHYVTIFGKAQEQSYFIQCLDLVFECMKFESFFESFIVNIPNQEMPISIQRSMSSTFSVRSDEDENGENQKLIRLTQQRFEIHVFAAMRSGIHNVITTRLSFLREESEDKQCFAFSFRKYDSEIFGKNAHHKGHHKGPPNGHPKGHENGSDDKVSTLSITEHEELCAIYAIHDVFKLVERLKSSHDDTYRATLHEFFHIENVHDIVSGAMLNPIVQFLDDFRDDIKTLFKTSEVKQVLKYRQVERIATEINSIFDYLATNTTAKSNRLLSHKHLHHDHGASSESVHEKDSPQKPEVIKQVEAEEEGHRDWLKLKRMTVLEPMTDYFIGTLSTTIKMVGRAISTDKFVAKKRKNGILHSTSPVDVINILEQRVAVLLKHELKPMQIVQLSEMITSILIMFVTITSERTRQEILSSTLPLKPLQIECAEGMYPQKTGKNTRNLKKAAAAMLNLKAFQRRNSNTAKCRSHRLSISNQIRLSEQKDNVIEDRLLVMIGNLSFFRELFHGLQTDWQFGRRYVESMEICENTKQFAKWWNRSNSDQTASWVRPRTSSWIHNEGALMDEDTVRPMLRSKKFYDAVSEAMEDSAQRLAEKLSTLSIGQLRKAVDHVADCHEPDIKGDVMFNLTAILIAFDEIPAEIGEFQKFLMTAFLSHFFLGIERQFLVPNRSEDVLSMNGVLFLNDLLRDFESLLGEFGVISNESLLNREFYDFPELTRIHAIIVVLLSNTKQIVEEFTERIKVEEEVRKLECDGIDDGLIHIELLQEDEPRRRDNAPYVEAKALLLMIKHRADVTKDQEAVQFVKRYKTIKDSMKCTVTGNETFHQKLHQFKNTIKKTGSTIKETIKSGRSSPAITPAPKPVKERRISWKV